MGRRRGNDASLRGSLCRWMEHLLFQVAGLEPSAQSSLVSGETIKQPIVVEIQTTPDIPFQNPFGTSSPAQREKAIGYRILRGALFAKVVGALVGQRFGHRVQRKQFQCLLGPVCLHGNAERAAFSARCRPLPRYVCPVWS